MDELLEQQELYFTPLSGEFDVERVAEVIRPLGFSYRDEAVPSIFLIFRDGESREVCRARRQSDPAAPLPYVLLIRAQPDEILVNQFAGPEFGPYSRAFLEWLLANYECSVHNEEGTDLTAGLPKPEPTSTLRR
ncbi:hypothetical protein [Vitiosangium sp. GDMCC 1.1324]|uniref:hypothetical protein n=1 Tax=Vitiosangium sp. (strain GDMCC 1.1324) TaxID=2138576 RepID=UPI000D3888AE|nr:hypothetical protein [Vitiosangium sp. GDMCC 1.1324]PTL85696.1 hypothetical protein DAT35_03010 [Vitiosangium sp. GDMCC 1.1324]